MPSRFERRCRCCGMCLCRFSGALFKLNFSVLMILDFYLNSKTHLQSVPFFAKILIIGDRTSFLCIQGTTGSYWSWRDLPTGTSKWVWEVWWYAFITTTWLLSLLETKYKARQNIIYFPHDSFDRVGLEKAKKELAGSIQKGISFIWK